VVTGTDQRKAVVLLSGGMDSCVCTAVAREGHGASNIALLHASYGQRTQERERRAFDDIANFYGVHERLAVQLDHFRAIGGSALTDKSISVPENELGAPGPHGSAIPITYVPFRNAHFLSVAVSWAEAIGAGAIYIGAVAEDSSGYPDCRPEYYRVFQELIRVGTRPETQIEIVTPVITLKKSAIIRRGIETGRATASNLVVLPERRYRLRRLRQLPAAPAGIFGSRLGGPHPLPANCSAGG